MDHSVITALIGAGGALLGSVVGGVVTYLIQTRLADRAARHEAALRAQDRRLSALQALNTAIDVVLGNEGRTEGGDVRELMSNVTRELPSQIAFLPDELREEARKLVLEFFSAARMGKMSISLASTTDLKNKALRAIDDYFEGVLAAGS